MYFVVILLTMLFSLLTWLHPVLAGPASLNYELKNYGFGAGGIQEASSGSYLMQGIIGEQSENQLTGDQYNAGPGLIFTEQANVPPAPLFTNPGSTYDRLKLIIQTGNNPTDAEFAVTISTDDFLTTGYIQNDFTIGSTLGAEDWLTYAAWNNGVGRYITGLAADTTYAVMVKARHGNFTESGWGPVASASTNVPSLTFSVSDDAILFDVLDSANSWTDSGKTTTITTSTNAYNGYIVYAHETGPLTNQNSDEIPDYGSPNSAPNPWSGTGFGYTTDDSALTGGVGDRFTDGGPNYAGFVTDEPGDPVADHSGPIVDTPISNDIFNISYRITGDVNVRAGRYANTIIYIVVPTY